MVSPLDAVVAPPCKVPPHVPSLLVAFVRVYLKFAGQRLEVCLPTGREPPTGTPRFGSLCRAIGPRSLGQGGHRVPPKPYGLCPPSVWLRSFAHLRIRPRAPALREA